MLILTQLKSWLDKTQPQVTAQCAPGTRSQLITSRSLDIQADISADFHDKNFNYISTAKGHDTKTPGPT